MFESPRTKAILDRLESGDEYEEDTKKIGPLTLNSRVVLKSLRHLSESQMSAPYGQEKLLSLVKDYNKDQQNITKSVLSTVPNNHVTYKLGKLRASNFRGLQIFNGPVFEYNFNGNSQLITGSNGTGKSSIANAIVWLFTGKLLWDRTSPCEAPKISIHNELDGNKTITQNWSSEIALPDFQLLNQKPDYVCWVELELLPSTADKPLLIRRELSNSKQSFVTGMPDLDILSIDLSILMPAKVNHIQFTANSDISQLFLTISGLDSLNYIGNYSKEMQKVCSRFLTQYKEEIKIIDQKNHDLGEKINSKIPLDLLDEYKVIETTGNNSQKISQKQHWLLDKAEERIKVLANVLNIHDVESISKDHSLLTQIITAHEAITQVNMHTWDVIKCIALCHLKYSSTEVSNFIKLIADTTEQLLLSLDWHRKKQEVKRLELLLQAVKLLPEDSSLEICPLCEQQLNPENPIKAELRTIKNLGEEATSPLLEIVKRSCQRLQNSVPECLDVLNTYNFAQTLHKELDVNVIRFLNNGLKNLKTKFFEQIDKIVGAIDFNHFKGTEIEESIIELEKLQHGNILDDYVSLANVYLDKVIMLNWIRSHKNSFLNDLANVLGFEENPSTDSLIKLLSDCKNIVMSITPLHDVCNEMEEYKNNLLKREKIVQDSQTIGEIKVALKELESLKEFADHLLTDDLESIKSLIQQNYFDLYGTTEFPLKVIEPRRLGRQIDIKFLVEHRGVLIEAAPFINASRIRALLWAYIFAMSEKRRETTKKGWLDFIILDDPLSSFDEGHRTKFAKKVFGSQVSTQFIVTSHDPDWPRHMKQYGLTPQIQRVKSLSAVRNVISIYEWKHEVRKELSSWLEDKKDEILAKRYVDAVRIWLEEELKDILVYNSTAPRIDDNLESLLKKLIYAHKQVDIYQSTLYQELYNEIKKLPEDIHNAHHGGNLRSRIYSEEAEIVLGHYTKIDTLLDRCWEDFRSKLYALSTTNIHQISV